MSDNNHAIIVGGAGGIGRAAAQRLAGEGYRITVVDLNLDGAQALVATLPGSGHDAVQANVMEDHSIDAALDAIEAKAPARVIVVASGGMFSDPSVVPNVVTTSTEEWAKTLVYNVSGVFFCIRKFGQQRQANPVENARVVVISSTAGEFAGSPTSIAYVTSKAGVFGLVRQAAFDLGRDNITVNAIAPGPISTDLIMKYTTPEQREMMVIPSVVKRLGTPEEVAAGISFLASTEAAYITGTTLDINGGIHMH